MSTYIDLDSSYRERTAYPNPCEYIVTADQVSGWPRTARQVTAHAGRPGSNAVEFSQSIQVKHVILPYATATYSVNPEPGFSLQPGGETVITHTADLQRIYLDVHSEGKNDMHLVNTIGDKIPKARFILTQEKVQFDRLGVPKWVHFGCRIDQAMRFDRNRPVTISIMQEQGKVLFIDDLTSAIVAPPITVPPTPPFDPVHENDVKALQTYILMEVIPYFRDADYRSHGLTQF